MLWECYSTDMKENVWPGEQLYSLVSLYKNVCLQNAVIDQSEWSIPESRVIVCGWLYIIAYIMLLYLISNKQQGLCTTSVSKTDIQLRHDAPYPSHLFLVLPVWNFAVSCILSVPPVFSLLRPIMSPLVCSRSVVSCYPRKSSVASLPPFFTLQSAVSDSCHFLLSHITIVSESVRLIPSPIIWASFPVMSHLPSLPCIFSCSCRCHAIVWPRLALFHQTCSDLYLHPSEKKHLSHRCRS